MVQSYEYSETEQIVIVHGDKNFFMRVVKHR